MAKDYSKTVDDGKEINLCTLVIKNITNAQAKAAVKLLYGRDFEKADYKIIENNELIGEEDIDVKPDI